MVTNAPIDRSLTPLLRDFYLPFNRLRRLSGRRA